VYRYSGSGNTFLIVQDASADVLLCDRYGVDGMIQVLPSDMADCAMIYRNRDGTRAMCGNGLRCAAHFASRNMLDGKSELTIETDVGVKQAKVVADQVEVSLCAFPVISPTSFGQFLDTGVPHLVRSVPSIEQLDVDMYGRYIRYHEFFAPMGTNVTFFERTDKGSIAIRTYERGVERETLSCGTGAVAAAACLFSSIESSFVGVFCRSRERLQVTNRSGTLFLEGGVFGERC